MKAYAALLLAIVGIAPAVAQSGQIIPLANPGSPEGSAPDGCRAALTGRGGAVSWKAVKIDGRAAIAETSGKLVDQRYPMCIVDKVVASDVELSVAFTPMDGIIDQAAGLAFRIKDADNYYVVRANALENNVNLYHVVQGVRWQFAGTDAPVVSRKLQRLGVRIEGDLINVSLNGAPLFEARDQTIRGPGTVGVWTKADSYTAFEDLSATVLKE